MQRTPGPAGPITPDEIGLPYRGAMRRNDPPNPYREMLLSALADEMMRRAGDLLADRKVGRRDTAYMLISASHALSPSVGSPGSPFVRVRAREPYWTALQEYGDLLDGEVRSLRWRLANEAMEAADWPPVGSRGRWGGQARASDEAFRAVLSRIDAREPPEE